jgi:flavin-dependent dehydrogenase
LSVERWDVVVIGGGPSGASLATLLARGGRRVLVLEKEAFPRFHIGESLLPCSMPLFESLGVLPELERRFLPKHGAEFVTDDSSVYRRYPFADGSISGPTSAFQVDRAEFDSVLLAGARAAGAEVRHRVQVVGFDLEASRARLTARDLEGKSFELECQLVADASGQQSLLAGRMGLRVMDPVLRNFSIFSHYEGARRNSGPSEGDISIVLSPIGWWWVIPMRGDRTSVGWVAPVSALRGRKPDEEYFNEQIASSPYLAQRFAGARRVAPVRTVSDWSYTSKRVAGDRWVLVGDAGAFIDPVFSTGVHLGVSSAFRAAEAIENVLAKQRFQASEFASYARYVRRGVEVYRDFVHGFYHPAFVELLLQPSSFMGLRQAVTSLLAGHGLENRDVAQRVRVFRMLARLNRHVPIAPRMPDRRAAFGAMS